MIELLAMPGDRVVGVKIDGKIQKADIQAIEAAFAHKFEQFDRVGIYVEVAHLGGITLDALVEDLKFGLSKFQRFAKKAVVSEQQWMNKVAVVSDKLFPSIEVKHFSFAEKADAIAWANATGLAQAEGP
jgi:hypothetical protein